MGHYHGEGKIKYEDGSSFEGSWKRGMQLKGVQTFSDNSRYEGEFSNGQRQGKGTYYDKNGRVYKGSWKKDV